MVYYTLLFNFFTYSTHMLSSWKLHTYEHYLKLILTKTTSTMFNPFKMIQMHPKNLLLLTSHQTNVSFWTSCILRSMTSSIFSHHSHSYYQDIYTPYKCILLYPMEWNLNCYVNLFPPKHNNVDMMVFQWSSIHPK